MRLFLLHFNKTLKHSSLKSFLQRVKSEIYGVKKGAHKD